MKLSYIKVKNNYLLIGTIFIIFLGIFSLSLGEDVLISPHDQFDGEVFTYIMHILHPSADNYKEIMDGLPKEGMHLASPGLLIFYLFFKPSTAYICSTIFIMLIAFIGMHFWLNALNIEATISFIISMLFASLPFFFVYGLSIMGLPLFFYIGLLWKPEDKEKKTYLIICIDALIYGLFSSLILCGYAVLLLLTGLWVYLKTKKQTIHIRQRIFLLLGSLSITYIFTNLELILQVLGQIGYTSHKSEAILTAKSFSLRNIIKFWINGQGHAVSNHRFLLPLMIGAILVYAIRKRYKNIATDNYTEYLFHLLKCVLGSSFLIAFFYVCFHSEFGIKCRNQLPSAIKSFQFDRIYWLYPWFWYTGAALAIEILFIMTQKKYKKICKCVCLCFLCLTFVQSASDNILYLNALNIFVPKIVQKHNYFPTYTSFFSKDIFEKIKDDIGKKQSSYKVISIGLYPTVALYNGFYCLDGYSNNYPIEYKHAFYKIIQYELEKDDALKKYFCNWGNRCYAFSHEIGRNFMIPKDSELLIRDLSFNLDELRKMNCEYIFSAVQIKSEEQYGLHFMNNYSSNDSFYKIWVYQL